VKVKATIDWAAKPLGQQVHDPLGHDLGLARAGRGDDLDVAAAVAYGLQGRTVQARHRGLERVR
jgi:hypothetical protein